MRASVIRPKQNIPQSQKNKEWIKENVDWCIAMSPIGISRDIRELYNVFNGNISQEEYNHITKTYGIEYPAGKIKNIPLVRPLLNELISEQEERPIDYSVRSEDNDSVVDKNSEMGAKIISEIVSLVNSDGDIDQQISEMERYYKSYQSALEIGAHQAMKAYIQRHRLERKFSENFVDKLVTGRQYYRAHLRRRGEDPIYRVINPGDLYYSDDNVKWVKECKWAVFPEELAPTEVLDRYGDDLSEEDRRKIEDMLEQADSDSMGIKMAHPSEADELAEIAGHSVLSEVSKTYKLTIYNVEFKSIKRVYYLEMPNPYDPEVPHVKFLKEGQEKEIPKSRRKYLRQRFIEERYEGVRIGTDIFTRLGKSKFVTYSRKEPSKCFLSFNGLTYNGATKPFSYIEVTRDIERLYRVMHFHKENLIALSGARGSYMDIKQMPDFSGTNDTTQNIKLFLYYKKLGTAFIDSSKASANGYNQFGTYDDTLGNGIGVIIQVIQHLEDLAGRIIGVSRQRMGNISQRDGKATTEAALFQQQMITQYTYNEHDEFTQQALEDILNLARHSWKNGYTASYISDEFVQKAFTLDADLSLSDFGVYITTRGSEARNVEQLKSIAMQLATHGMVQFEDVLPLFRKTNFKDVLRHIEYNLDNRRREIQQQQAQMQQLEAQLEQARSQVEIQKIAAEIEKIKSDIEINRHKAALEEKELQVEENFNSQKIALDAKRVELEAQELQASVRDNNNKNNKEIKNN